MTELRALVLAWVLALALPALAQNPLDGVLAQMLTSPRAQWDVILDKNREQLAAAQLKPVLKRATALAARGRDREAVDLVLAADYVDYYLSGKKAYRGTGQIALAMFLLEQGQQVRAGSIAEGLIADYPDLENAQLLMGKVLAQSSPGDAMAWFQKVAEKNPQSEDAFQGIGQIYLMVGQAKEALRAFQKVLEINPDNGLARDVVNQLTAPSTGQPPSKNPTAMKHYRTAEQLFQDRLFEQAIAQYDLALKADPRFARVWLYKGDCYFQMSQFDKAIVCYKKSIELDPKDPQAYRFLGDVLERKYAATRDVKLLDEAIGCYETALKLHPNYGAARDDLARARKLREAHK